MISFSSVIRILQVCIIIFFLQNLINLAGIPHNTTNPTYSLIFLDILLDTVAITAHLPKFKKIQIFYRLKLIVNKRDSDSNCHTFADRQITSIEYFDFPKNVFIQGFFLFIQGLYYCTTNSDPCTINTNLVLLYHVLLYYCSIQQRSLYNKYKPWMNK